MARSLTLIGAVTLLTAGVVVGAGNAGERHRKALDSEIASIAKEQALALDAYFARAREINLLIAQNPVFRNFDHTHAHAGDRRELNAALAYLEHLYPGQISEACFIDVGGAESARVVDGHHAGPHELSSNEAANPFFAPTFAAPTGVVYQATPYVSPDTHKWVISNSTPIRDRTGRKSAILHFEVTLASFGKALRTPRPAVITQIADARTGTVVLDSRFPDGVALGSSDTGPVATSSPRGSAQPAGTRSVSRPVQAGQGNANRWVVITSAPAAAGLSFKGVGADSLLMMGAALALLGIAMFGFLADRRRLRAAALTDPLTGLPNRVLFAARIDRAIADARREGHQVATALLDLDRFKEVNDTLGHHAGDVLLIEVAKRLQAVSGPGTTVARLGGDEFAMLFPHVIDPVEVVDAARRALDSLREPVRIGEAQVGVSGSIGLAYWPDHGESVDGLLQRADIAMYWAKRTAAEVATYHPDFDTHTPERLALMTELRAAIASGQLTLVFQPKVDVTTNDVTGVEALVRWNHPRRGCLPPAVFLLIAEELGLEVALTADVLRQALTQCRAWLDAGLSLQVAVNLPARCAQDPATVDLVAQELGRCDVPSSHLRLEITETSFVGDTNRALEVLLRLEQLGVTLSIDDYGTGYSSLAYLKRLPVHELKIDRAFVADLVDDTTDADIVRSTIDLGHRMGFSVVAEGVETDDAAALLADAGCDTVQGFLYSKPLPADELVSWLWQWRSCGLRAVEAPGIRPAQAVTG